MTYDQWKLRSPDDEFYRYGLYDDHGEEPECHHEDYDADILTGRATCNMCGHVWWRTKEEMEAEERRQRECDTIMRREARREWWQKKTYPVRWAMYRILNRIWPSKSHKVLTDDDVPF